jgi:hypothetical protein
VSVETFGARSPTFGILLLAVTRTCAAAPVSVVPCFVTTSTAQSPAFGNGTFAA